MRELCDQSTVPQVVNGNKGVLYQCNPMISIAWKNLCLEITQFSGWKPEKKIILKELTGNFKVATLNGLLGPSGAGKTTLLNCLSGTKTSGLSERSFIYTAKKKATSFFIAQHVHEIIIGKLTVEQILRYAYQFKNESGISTGNQNKEIDKFIKSTLKNLLLDESILERPFAVCSGGEQKRIAIAQELMSHQAPAFLFLDEPTTGLDSAAALKVMASLQTLARSQSITVIASIHAPNNETLSLFDQLYVLAKGGVSLYSGPPNQIRAYLEAEIGYRIPDQQPSIEFLLKIACNGIVDRNVAKLATQTFSKETLALESSIPLLSLQPNSLPTPRKFFSLANFFTQLSRQLRITFIAQIRTLFATLLIYVSLFSVLSTIFSPEKARSSGCYFLEGHLTVNHTCNPEAHLLADTMAKENGHYLSYVVLLTGLAYLTSSTALYSTHVSVFKAEHRNGWYSLGVFFWSSTITSFLELTFTSTLLSLMTYFLSAQHAADEYSINWTRLKFYLIFLYLLAFFYQTIGQLISILFVDHPQIAFLVGQLSYTTTCLFNGLYIKLHRMELNVLLLQLNEWLGLAYLSKGLIYAIYGVDRCEADKEYSWVLLDYEVDGEAIGTYIWRVLLNIAIVKLVSLAVMYIKFNTFYTRKQLMEVHKNEKRGIDHEIDLDETESEEINQIEVVPTTTEVQLAANKILIGWRNLTLFCSDSLFEMSSKENRRKSILRNLNGQFCFGTLNALMGTSGAGKTSLLKVLNGRCKTRLSDETEMYLSNLMTITTCFITQEVSGHLMSGLTAKQMLTYASRLKNVQNSVDHDQIAVKWLHELDLLSTASTNVEKCSGGERKRLAVALEMTALVLPNCICIDEPTSGLDTNSAEIVISCLRKLTRFHPLTIITSIHQPTAEVLFMFDQLYMLARGGVCIFSGPPSAIHSHLDQVCEISLSQSGTQFPIETLIKQSCSSESTESVQKLAKLTASQFENMGNLQLFEQTQPSPDGVIRNRKRFSLHSVFSLSLRFLAYIRGHLWKIWLFTIISSLGYAYSLTFFFNTKIIYVSGCINLEEDTRKCTKTTQEAEDEFLLIDNLRYTFFFSSIYFLLIMIGTLINFTQEFPYFLNEHRNGWYSAGSYYLMKSIFEIIPLIITNFVYVYIIDIYDPVVRESLYWPLFNLLTLASIGYIGLAHCCILLFRGNFMGQMLLLICIYVFLMILSNFLIPITKMHYIYQFLSHFGLSRYILELFTLLQYGFNRCQPREIQGVLYSMSITDADYYPDILMLVFNVILYRLFAIYLFIRRVNPIENRQKRISRISQYREKVLKNAPQQSVLDPLWEPLPMGNSTFN